MSSSVSLDPRYLFPPSPFNSKSQRGSPDANRSAAHARDSHSLPPGPHPHRYHEIFLSLINRAILLRRMAFDIRGAAPRGGESGEDVFQKRPKKCHRRIKRQ